jgi:hypothetical protein
LAYAYVYYPSGGWRWVLSPWVLGWGPRPYWGAWGVARFGWYSHPWFRVGVYNARVWRQQGYRGHYYYSRGYARGYEHGYAHGHRR